MIQGRNRFRIGAASRTIGNREGDGIGLIGRVEPIVVLDIGSIGKGVIAKIPGIGSTAIEGWGSTEGNIAVAAKGQAGRNRKVAILGKSLVEHEANEEGEEKRAISFHR